jgi:hypothetical protein
VFLGGQQEYFVAIFDDRIASRSDRPVTAIDRSDPSLDSRWQMIGHFLDRATN